jgi:hypothetical protein
MQVNATPLDGRSPFVLGPRARCHPGGQIAAPSRRRPTSSSNQIPLLVPLSLPLEAERQQHHGAPVGSMRLGRTKWDRLGSLPLVRRGHHGPFADLPLLEKRQLDLMHLVPQTAAAECLALEVAVAEISGELDDAPAKLAEIGRG